MLIAADYASVDLATGKLNILGAFTRMHVKTFPYSHHRMALVVKLAAADILEPTDMRVFSVVMTDEDGTEYLQMSGGVQIPRDEYGNRPDANIILETNGLEFPHPGVYSFTIYIDGQELDHTAVEVVSTERQ